MIKAICHSCYVENDWENEFQKTMRKDKEKVRQLFWDDRKVDYVVCDIGPEQFYICKKHLASSIKQLKTLQKGFNGKD